MICQYFSIFISMHFTVIDRKKKGNRANAKNVVFLFYLLTHFECHRRSNSSTSLLHKKFCGWNVRNRGDVSTKWNTVYKVLWWKNKFKCQTREFIIEYWRFLYVAPIVVMPSTLSIASKSTSLFIYRMHIVSQENSPSSSIFQIMLFVSFAMQASDVSWGWFEKPIPYPLLTFYHFPSPANIFSIRKNIIKSKT